jgi:FkbM family methyltransferase
MGSYNASAVKLLTELLQKRSLIGVSGIATTAAARICRSRFLITVHPPGFAHPIQLRARTQDVQAYEEVLLGREYECDLSSIPKVIIDAGAHIGLASIYFANRYPSARIIAIEPETDNFRLLRKNVARYANIETVWAALLPIDGFVGLRDHGETWGFEVDGPGSIPAISMQSLLSGFGIDCIDLLKLDIEGSERELFSEGTEWILKVRSVIVEDHDWLKPRCREAVLAALLDFHCAPQGNLTFFAR